jgi:hypothetical protein
MRFALLLFVALFAPDQSEETSTDDANDQRMKFMKSALARFTIKVGERKDFGRVGEPCFRITNPLTGVKDGVIAVYSANSGRPDVIAKFFRQKEGAWVNEFAVIAADDVTIMRNDQPFWKVKEYMCKFNVVPDSPVPAARPLQRLGQMRTIAENFSVIDHFGLNDIVDHNLRLLTKPIYRYSEGEITDGALFGFALGTNLQCSLLLEAYKDENGSRYRYAFAPMSIYGQDASYKDTHVWEVEPRIIFGQNCRKYFSQGYQIAPDDTLPD